MTEIQLKLYNPPKNRNENNLTNFENFFIDRNKIFWKFLFYFCTKKYADFEYNNGFLKNYFLFCFLRVNPICTGVKPISPKGVIRRFFFQTQKTVLFFFL